MNSCICILVLYNPDLKLINKVLSAVLPQVEKVIMLDNSSNLVVDNILYSDQVVYKKMNGNEGISVAQNAGIEYAIKHNYKYVFFLDQDSLCPKNIVSSLIEVYESLKTAGYKVGAIGPNAINRSSGNSYVDKSRCVKLINEDILEVSELISSASLIEVSTFMHVGSMDAALFIDGVDYEWCWRASQKANYSFYIAKNILLSHQLGEGDRYFLWKKVAIPTPFRTYYQFRNYFILCRRSYVPISWKITNGVKYLIKLFYYSLFISPRMKYMQNICKGIIQGIFYKF